MTDFLGAMRQIRGSCAEVPIVADCDSGFGDMHAVVRMVREYEQVGAAAICIEDQVFPKRNSLDSGHRLCSPQEFATKVRIAKEAQQDPDFMIWARLESLIAGKGIPDALARAELYEEAGADAILIHSKATTPDEVLAFLASFRGGGSQLPVALVPTTYPQLSLEDACSAGANAIIYANQALRASITAVRQVFGKILKDGDSLAVEGSIESVRAVLDFTGMPGIRQRERQAEILEWTFTRGSRLPSRELPR
jgi:phosphoenolpyruvate phosphomutase